MVVSSKKAKIEDFIKPSNVCCLKMPFKNNKLQYFSWKRNAVNYEHSFFYLEGVVIAIL